MKRVTCVLLIIGITFTGCAGRMANPISVYLPGDESRPCSGLKTEIAQLQVDMAALLPKTDKFGTNTLWAVGGVLFLFPFFFMDFKDAERIEFEAMRRRHNRLLNYAVEKNCDLGEVRAEIIPNIEQQAREARKARAEARKNASYRAYVPTR